MSVLAEPSRIKILEIISADGEKCARDILPVFRITQPTLSHHLNLMLDSEILSARKEGRFVYYSVNKESVSAIRDLLDSFLEPPVVRTVKAKEDKSSGLAPKTKPVLKKSGSVPEPKVVIASPDLEEIKKAKKKKKPEKKKKDKEKDKKKKR